MEKKKRLALIAWEKICMPFNKGGLGLRRVTTMNDYLLSKLLWRRHKEEGEWRGIWNDKYNRENQDLKHFLNNETFQGVQ